MLEAIDRNYSDYILAINGTPVENHNDLLETFDSYKPGDRLQLTILREGAKQTLELTLGQMQN